MPLKVKLTSAPTEAGAAIEMKDGWPVVITEGEGEVPWDLDRQASSLAAANAEAAARRKALKAIADSLGVTADVHSDIGLQALQERAGAVAAMLPDLDRLKKLETDGKLDATASDKIAAAAQKLRNEEFSQLEVRLQTADRERAEAVAQSARDAAALRESQLSQAVVAYATANSAKLRDGALPGFMRAVRAASPDGFEWKPTGRVDEAGIPIVVRQAPDGTVQKSADGAEPLSLGKWVEHALVKSDPYLFRQPEGTGVNFDGNGLSAGKSLADLSLDQITALAEKQFAA